MKNKKIKKYSTGSTILSAFFLLLSLVWIMPIFEVLINSLKSNNYVNLEPFALPNEEGFVGFANYLKGFTGTSPACSPPQPTSSTICACSA